LDFFELLVLVIFIKKLEPIWFQIKSNFIFITPNQTIFKNNIKYFN
jgi:hypothetical protein